MKYVCMVFWGAWLLALHADVMGAEESCEGDASIGRRYLMYTVNPGEGFNLSRDVYMRVVSLMQTLNKDEDIWTLVLTPWTNPHWREERFPSWKKFFDIEQLATRIPVIELDEFLKTHPADIDHVLHLQPADVVGEWKDTVDKTECDFGTYPGTKYWKDGDKWKGTFWGRSDMTAKDLSCYNVFGTVDVFAETIQQTDGDVILVARFEELLHKDFGSVEYWKTRQSMVFASSLREISKDFWENVIGQPYLAVHFRRADFLYARKKDIPTPEQAVEQLKAKMKKYNVKAVFVATDARYNDEEFFTTIEQSGLNVYTFPTGNTIRSNKKAAASTYSEGQRAIIDQWICANAEVFVGTRESTFSNRIHEERDLMGKDPESTFYSLCPKTTDENGVKGYHCKMSQRWAPKYEQ